MVVFGVVFSEIYAVSRPREDWGFWHDGGAICVDNYVPRAVDVDGLRSLCLLTYYVLNRCTGGEDGIFGDVLFVLFEGGDVVWANARVAKCVVVEDVVKVFFLQRDRVAA